VTANPEQSPPGYEFPVRVSTLELFFDLVFVFTITQLTGILARDFSVVGALRVLLIFGVLWWMYGGYAWLTNTRTPDRPAERVLLLLGMAGFLVVGLAIPGAFGRDGVALGVGYLVVVLVHAGLYFRVNKNILRVAPFNVASALIVIVAGIASGPSAYVLWTVALAVLALSPVLVHPRGRFQIQPAHFVERHGALIIVTFGESVADIGIGAAGLAVTVPLVSAAAFGLALTAVLWWVYFGVGDDERAQQAMTKADPAYRAVLALSAYFYAYIPMLLGVVAMAAGVKRAIGQAGTTLPAGPSLALAGGVALFLAGNVVFRRALRTGPVAIRTAAALAALATTAVGVTVAVEAEMALLAGIVVLALVAETRQARQSAGREPG
jgi:low temperature requirement protein LtrA